MTLVGSMKRFLACLGAFLVAATGLVVLPATTANAQDNGRWAVYPVTRDGNDISPRQYFIFDATPGKTIKDSVTVRNRTVRPLVLDVYPADAFNTTAGGAFALKKQDEKQTDVGSWITLSTKQVTVPPMKKNKKGVLTAGS